jgi:hypothetical protein
MKLHANARTCPKSRELIVRRIEEQGWSLATAAEAAGVSERNRGQVAIALARRGGGGPHRPQLGAEDEAHAVARQPGGGDRGPAAAANDRR